MDVPVDEVHKKTTENAMPKTHQQNNNTYKFPPFAEEHSYGFTRTYE